MSLEEALAELAEYLFESGLDYYSACQDLAYSALSRGDAVAASYYRDLAEQDSDE